MSYQVLARKWRPRRFSELVGQEHVVRALSNALDGDRLHHAYLFTGTRGVGKTTIARIFAKSLNCERGQSADPCGECAVCTAVDAGRFVDLLEIDAASNTGVDDVRELIENAHYAPARGRFKVYLIDEVHMLSKPAFNALLKTLEEPPPHVKFLLATTDPEKLLVTVLSRCLKFNLKRLLPQQMIEQMRMILAAENVAFEDTALGDIAHAADGSMRDALSLLDQSIAYGGGDLRAGETRSMLGTIDHGGVLALLQALADGNGEALLAESERIAGYSPDFMAVLDQLSAALHRLQMYQLVPEYTGDNDATAADLKDIAERMDAEDVQLYYQMATHGRGDLPLAPNAQSGFEMVLLRMLAFRPSGGNDKPAPKRQRADTVVAAHAGTAQKPPPTKPATKPIAEAPAKSMVGSSRVAEPVPMIAATPVPNVDWDRLIAQAKLGGPVGQLARHAVLSKIDGQVWTLSLKPTHFDLAVEPMTSRLQEQLTAVQGVPVMLRFVAGEDIGETPAERVSQAQSAQQADAERAIHDDPLVHRFESEFGARVVPQSIRPLER